VVQHIDLQEFTGLFQSVGKADILLAGIEIARGMVMGQDDGTGIGFQGDHEDYQFLLDGHQPD